MAIERSVEILVMCDHYDEGVMGSGLLSVAAGSRCPETRDSQWDTIVDAKFWLRDEGWTIGKRTLCPEHA